MLTYSVRPRGGVVHALSVAGRAGRPRARSRAVRDRPAGHRASSARPPSRRTSWPTSPPDAPFDERICALIDAYTEGLREPLRAGGYDVVHAQDCISANAALTLREDGVIDAVVRTVHHVDDFRSPSLIACQERSIVAPDRVLVVSTPWIARLRDEFGIEAELVPNGVDSERFRPPRDAAERAAAREAAGLDGELAILTVGGIEPRKGSLTLLRAFAAVRQALPDRRPVLLVAGGATLFDHRDEIDRFHALRDDLDLGDSVRVLGPVTDPELDSLYRAADLFALPSTKEGFGLAVLEALGAGVPAVVSDLDVFRTYLTDGDSALMAPVGDHAALADALVRAAARPRSRRGCATAGGPWRRATAGTRPRAPTSGLRALHGDGGALMALEVVATWRGGLATDVRARQHTIRVDEPLTSGGGDSGMMPTELFCAALASCFCLAVGFAAGKRDQEVPGLR